MSRHSVKVGKDSDCCVGFDEANESFFFQSGAEDRDGRPVVWLGWKRRQFLRVVDLESRVEEETVAGFRFPPETAKALEDDLAAHFTAAYTGRELREIMQFIAGLGRGMAR